MKKNSLYPTPEPVKVNPAALLFWIFIFAIGFFMLGVLTMHYPSISAVI